MSAIRSSGVLDPAREAHQILGHCCARSLHGLVRHRLGNLDQRLDPAERLGEREDLRRRGDPARVRMPERHHAAEAGPAHVVHPGRPAEVLAQRAPVVRVCAHANAERPEPRCTRKQSSGPGTAPTAFCTKRIRSCSSGIRYHHSAADRVGMTAEVLGGGVDDHMGAQLERPLDHRRGEGVVHGHQRAPRSGDHAFDVDHLEAGVGRGLDPDQGGVVPHGGLHRVEVPLIHEGVLEPPATSTLSTRRKVPP